MLPQNLAALAADPLDQIALGTIAGATYYEMHFVVKIADGRTAVVGRASDWPVISRDARISELEQLLAATQQQAAEAERHAAALAAQLGSLEDARLALLDAPAEPAPPPPVDEALTPCPYGCGKAFRGKALGGHKSRCPQKPAQPESPPPARPALVAVTPAAEPPLVEAPWACGQCGESKFARSVLRPHLCMRCNALQEAAPTSERAVAA